MDAANNIEDRIIVTTRIVDAPRALVFDAFTDPAHLARWWGPNGFTLTTQSFDMRPGGIWQFVMHGPDGRDYPNRIMFDEIEKPHRIAYRHADDESVRFSTVITLEDLGGRTRVTLRALFPTAADREFVIRDHRADEGGRQTLGRLAAMIEEDFFTFTRSLDAPRELVWKVWSEAQHLAKWWGPKGFDWIDGKIDFRAGGLFHYGMKMPDGKEMWGRFVFHEIVPPERLTFVSSFSDAQGGLTRAPFFADWPLEVFNTLTLKEESGKTVMTLKGAPVGANEAERDRFRSMKPSMNQGWSGTMEQLEAYLIAVKA